MDTAITCGEATVRLLHRYGVTTVVGVPGVHTLDLCRGLGDGIAHVQARNEQGAGFTAEGWARATGGWGVALVISGPGVTNACTAERPGVRPRGLPLPVRRWVGGGFDPR